MRGQAEPKEIKQKIREDMLLDIEQSPEQVDNWYTNNIISRTISYLAALTDRDKAKVLRMTEAGALKVANIGSGLERVTTVDVTAGASISAAQALDFVASQVSIRSKDYAFTINTSPDGVIYYDPIWIGANERVFIDLTVHSFKVTRDGANDALVEVTGFR